MKVYLLNNTNTQISGEKRKQVSFRRKSDLGDLGKEVLKNSNWLPRFLTWLGKNDGEILNTLVTAVGTAIVAPIFIAGNPFSKEDKETKWYSAMRQPISAVIAVVMQLGVNKVFNNYMAKEASTGGFGELFDLRAMPKRSYLKRIAKLQHPEFNKKQIEELVDIMEITAEKEVVGKTRYAMKNKPLEMAELINADALNSAEKSLKEKAQEEFKHLKGKKLKKALEQKVTKELIRERALQNITADVEFEAQLKFKIRELANKFTTIDEAIAHLNKMIEKEENVKLAKKAIEKLEDIKVYEESKSLKPFSSLRKLGNTYEEVLHNVKIKRLVKNKASDAAKRFSKANKWAGIVVSLLTLPISCGLLNWAYPRIMEVWMPKLLPIIHRNDKDWLEAHAKELETKEKLEEDSDGED